MDCPYCGKEMREGRIPAQNQLLKWYESAGGDIWGEGVRLSEAFKDAEAFFCPDCRRIVMQVPEIEGVWSKMQRKLDAASEKLGAMREQLEERHSQAKKQKEKEKKGKKDPWEL